MHEDVVRFGQAKQKNGDGKEESVDAETEFPEAVAALRGAVKGSSSSSSTYGEQSRGRGAPTTSITDIEDLAEAAPAGTDAVFAELALPQNVDLNAEFEGLLRELLLNSLKHFAVFDEEDTSITRTPVDAAKLSVGAALVEHLSEDEDVHGEDVLEESTNVSAPTGAAAPAERTAQAGPQEPQEERTPPATASAFATDAKSFFSSHTCNLGPSCLFRNLCFQSFETHRIALRNIKNNGRPQFEVDAARRIVSALDFAYLLQR